MQHQEADQRRRLLIAWIFAVAICGIAVGAVQLLGGSPGARVAGFDVTPGLRGLTYVAGAAVAITTFRWLHAKLAKKPAIITVRQLRELAGRL